MYNNLNSPFTTTGGFAGHDLGPKLVTGPFETSDFLARHRLIDYENYFGNYYLEDYYFRDGFRPVLNDLYGEVYDYLKRLLTFGWFKKDIYDKWNNYEITVEEFIDLAKDEIIKEIPDFVLSHYKIYIFNKKNIPEKIRKANMYHSSGEPETTFEYWDSKYRKIFDRFIQCLRDIGIEADKYVSELVELLDSGIDEESYFIQQLKKNSSVKKLVLKKQNFQS